MKVMAAEAMDFARVSIRQLSCDSMDRRCKLVESWWPKTCRWVGRVSLQGCVHQGVYGMAGRIYKTVFWPGINPDIIRTRGSCMTCIREAPSQPAGFPVAPPSPNYLFQMLVADYFSLHSHNFLVIADRFTG